MKEIIEQLKESIEDLEIAIEDMDIQWDDIIIHRSWGQAISLGDCASYLKQTIDIHNKWLSERKGN